MMINDLSGSWNASMHHRSGHGSAYVAVVSLIIVLSAISMVLLLFGDDAFRLIGIAVSVIDIMSLMLFREYRKHGRRRSDGERNGDGM